MIRECITRLVDLVHFLCNCCPQFFNCQCVGVDGLLGLLTFLACLFIPGSNDQYIVTHQSGKTTPPLLTGLNDLVSFIKLLLNSPQVWLQGCQFCFHSSFSLLCSSHLLQCPRQPLLTSLVTQQRYLRNLHLKLSPTLHFSCSVIARLCAMVRHCVKETGDVSREERWGQASSSTMRVERCTWAASLARPSSWLSVTYNTIPLVLHR